ncbi:hypothetical protein B0H12DRAFT_726229 [Mycena haematopus]|nr:hypothetical protein B0H12DRAFT_726229 [Mycena haematopus]
MSPYTFSSFSMSQTSPYLRDVERSTTDRPISCKSHQATSPTSVAPLSLTQFVAATRCQSHHYSTRLYPAHIPFRST